jgi:hypothetical protein
LMGLGWMCCVVFVGVDGMKVDGWSGLLMKS